MHEKTWKSLGVAADFSRPAEAGRYTQKSAGSWYVPNTSRSASLISPTVA